MSASEVRETIVAAVNKIRRDSGRDEIQPSDDTPIAELGLDSLDLAVLVVSLEQSLGRDPFRDGAAQITSFGEFVELYR